MVKEYLIYGLKMAVSRGESLESAMNSFYNAGYSKDDIEEAAMALVTPPDQQGMQAPMQPRPMPVRMLPPMQKKPLPPPPSRPSQPAQKEQEQQQQQEKKPMGKPLPPPPGRKALPPPVKVMPRVSGYEGRIKKPSMAITVVLIILLLLLLGILAAVILFKDQLSGLLGNLSWLSFF